MAKRRHRRRRKRPLRALLPLMLALLAAYLVEQKGESLEDYLNNKVFAGNSGERMAPDARDVEGFAGFMDRYQKGLAAQRGAVDNLL